MMQATGRSMLLAACLLASVAPAFSDEASPLEKVLQLMDELMATVTKDGAAGDKAYAGYFEWCDDVAKESQFKIKTVSAKKAKLIANIEDLGSFIDACGTKIAELAGKISSAEGELKQATSIREKEEATFETGQDAIVATIDTFDRAFGILEKEMDKNPASFSQLDTSTISSLLQSFSVVIDAAGFTSTDRDKLLALVQEQQDSEADGEDENAAAPEGAVYKSQSGGILEVLSDLKDKADAQLSQLRKVEATSVHNYEMMKSALEFEIATDKRHMKEEKSSMAAAQEEKARDEGDLDVTVKQLSTAQEDDAVIKENCMTVAADHEATMKARQEQMRVLKEAKAVLEESTGGASDQTYSLLQVSAASRLATHRPSRDKVVHFVRQLAKQQHSTVLAQLASHIQAVVTYSHSENPFAKVKGMLKDMIAKLEREAKEDATEKAYCDEETAKTEEKQGELNDDITKLTVKIDRASARSTQLKEEVQELQAELAKLAKEQASMDEIRSAAHAEYVRSKADMEQGISGVKEALAMLRRYYGAAASSASAAAMLQDNAKADKEFDVFMQQPKAPQQFDKGEGAGGSILSVLEVVESDFALELTKIEAEEGNEQMEYDKISHENAVVKMKMVQDVKYKTQEFAGLDESLSQMSSDRNNANVEAAAVSEYFAKLKDRCVAKPEAYADRAQRRTAEIDGLKEALEILKSDAALIQQSGSGKHVHKNRLRIHSQGVLRGR